MCAVKFVLKKLCDRYSMIPYSEKVDRFCYRTLQITVSITGHDDDVRAAVEGRAVRQEGTVG